MKNQVDRLIDAVKKKVIKESQKPFVVSIMGQTGVGKSSLINALFKTRLKTDPVRPCTKDIQKVVTRDESGHELWFWDLPGIGESSGLDNQYLAEYRNKLLESDVVLWAIHSDSRSLAFDYHSFQHLIESVDDTQRCHLMSKITFVLTKADLLTPAPWILVKREKYGVFVPSRLTKKLLAQKASYCQSVFIRPYTDKILAQTYNDDGFKIVNGKLSFDDHHVYYRGFLDKTTLNTLRARYPQHKEVFLRLYDNYRVIPSSSLFRFNLAQLMLVIINKLGVDAVGRFSNFASQDVMNRIPITKAKKLCNIQILDDKSEQILFDLTTLNL